MSKLFQARFATTVNDIHCLPEVGLREVAFAGRSNAGKSTAINVLCNQKRLAFASKTPGRTQHINYFGLYAKDDLLAYLVDLPGYGYARVSKSAKQVFQQFITDYFNTREQLVCAFVLIDIRHEPQKIDLEFMAWMAENGVPFCIVFTKADKLGKSKVQSHVADYRKKMLAGEWEEMPPFFITSSLEGTGKADLLNYIDALNKEVFKSGEL